MDAGQVKLFEGFCGHIGVQRHVYPLDSLQKRVICQWPKYHYQTMEYQRHTFNARIKKEPNG